MPYTKTTDFAIKDTYLSGNPAKVVKGAEIDTEFENIETNFNSIGPLGTAAAATLTTTATDTTAGRVPEPAACRADQGAPGRSRRQHGG